MRHALGDAFFMQLRAQGEEVPTQGFLRTVNYEGSAANDGGLLSEGKIYAVRPTGRCPFPNFVSIGRTRNNDVVLPDLSISKFHAFLRPDHGCYKIQDAGSQNGTWIGDQRMTGKEALAMVPGLVLRLGAVQLTYLDAAGLHQVLRRV